MPAQFSNGPGIFYYFDSCYLVCHVNIVITLLPRSRPTTSLGNVLGATIRNLVQKCH